MNKIKSVKDDNLAKAIARNDKGDYLNPFELEKFLIELKTKISKNRDKNLTK